MNFFNIFCTHSRKIDLSEGERKGSWAWWRCLDCGKEDTDGYNI